jgi:hypothetical protein
MTAQFVTSQVTNKLSLKIQNYFCDFFAVYVIICVNVTTNAIILFASVVNPVKVEVWTPVGARARN